MIVRHVNLYAFKNLKRCRSVLFCNDERTAARLALVLYHTCNTYRTVEFRTDGLHALLACLGLRHLDTKYIIKESLDIVTESLNLRSRIDILIDRIITRNACHSHT